MSLPEIAQHSISNILLARSGHNRPLQLSKYGTSCTVNLCAKGSLTVITTPLVLSYPISLDYLARRRWPRQLSASPTNCPFNSKIPPQLACFNNALFTEDVLFTKAYKALETETARRIHVHTQLNARAVAGCLEIL
jgi:hypothetical protein